jgi:predicted Zn-dependent peptidase
MVPKEIEQVQICLGVPGLSYYSDDRYTQNVMNSILGGGMSSRLFQHLREELGLAYSVYSYPSNYSDTGSYNIYIGTSPAKVTKFFEALHEQLAEFVVGGVNHDEVARTQKLIKSSIYLGLESVMNRMTRLGKSLLMYNELTSPDKIIENIYAVTPEKVQNLAQNMFKLDLVSMAAIGDKEALPQVEKEYRKWWGKS